MTLGLFLVFLFSMLIVSWLRGGVGFIPFSLQPGLCTSLPLLLLPQTLSPSMSEVCSPFTLYHFPHTDVHAVLPFTGTVELAHMYTCIYVYLPICKRKWSEWTWFLWNIDIPHYLSIANGILQNIPLTQQVTKQGQEAGGVGKGQAQAKKINFKPARAIIEGFTQCSQNAVQSDTVQFSWARLFKLLSYSFQCPITPL